MHSPDRVPTVIRRGQRHQSVTCEEPACLEYEVLVTFRDPRDLYRLRFCSRHHMYLPLGEDRPITDDLQRSAAGSGGAAKRRHDVTALGTYLTTEPGRSILQKPERKLLVLAGATQSNMHRHGHHAPLLGLLAGGFFHRSIGTRFLITER